MMLSRRSLFAGAAGFALMHRLGIAHAATGFADIAMAAHEQAMRAAIAQARRNPAYPFGAVIARIADGAIQAHGVNNSAANPTLHGEIACMNDYVAHHGSKDWQAMVLYTTGEPCSMCMSALAWAGIGGVVFASSIDTIRRSGIPQIAISAQQVEDAATSFYHGGLLGGVLQAETDRMFMERKRS